LIEVFLSVGKYENGKGYKDAVFNTYIKTYKLSQKAIKYMSAKYYLLIFYIKDGLNV